MHAIIKKRWFLSQVGKAIDCNSMIAGSSPTGTSKKTILKKFEKKYCIIVCHLVLYLGICERNVAQLGSASGLGPEGCRFKSCHSDHCLWGHSSAGRAPALHAGGQGFDPPWLHHFFYKAE